MVRCKKDSYDYYVVENAKQWNALMGAPFANTSDGIISADVYIPYGKTISSPALSLTSTKTFSGKIEGYFYLPIEGFKGALFNSLSADSEIYNLTIKGLVCNTNNGSIVDIRVNAPVCNTNNGTISEVTVSGVKMTGYSGIAKTNSSTGKISSCYVSSCTITGSDSYAGAICGRNMGTIEDCTVSDCTIDGRTKNVKYTGGICGYNEGTISGSSTKVTGTVTGSTSNQTYTGGYCAYNKGTISDSGSVDITLSGSSEADSYYGYVIGYNDGGTVSTDITTTAQETVVDTGTITVDGSKYFDFTLERTSLATVSFTDTAANAAQLNAYLRLLTETGTVSKTLVSCSDIDNTTVTKKLYLSKGSYSIYLSEGYITSNKGCSAKVLID